MIRSAENIKKQSMRNLPSISIVIPCRNEFDYIAPCLDSIIANDYPQDRLEILISDGGSSDGTREIIRRYSACHSNIKLLDNLGETTPRAFNLGIKTATGDFILIINGHSTYPPTYVSDTLRLLLNSGAGNAGGRVVNIPNGNGPWALPVSFATAHRFGVGNSAFRTSDGAPQYVDTVAYGLYRKKIFDEIGLFDERLTRNQDNEFNDRLRKAGHKVIFSPAIMAFYKNQSTLSGLLHQGFYTGMWNVYTLALFPYSFKWRRFIPSVFVAYLLSIPMVLSLGRWGDYYVLPALLYLGLNLVISFTADYPVLVRARVAVTFLSYHLAYGFGTWLGLANVITGRWRGHLGKPLRK